ncbi:nitroreductase [Mesorhizobium sp. WSM4311]|nr:nitroreductase [Mesorhizobium sp. WSM4304]PBB73478.1 nitroreductase [Mesorhizobium sp. WSM4308]PBC24719.1 nitroreductase [Mesorhizobium sp. WSM4311]TRD09543.1 nitroreductase [Mesorhizobium sp. WSM4305]
MLKICLQDFDGSCKGSAASGEWGRPIDAMAKGRPMLEKKARIADEAEIVDEAIVSRRSVRAFLPDMVDDNTIRDILAVAARAPSGTNMQPWRVYVTKGETKQRISDAVLNSGIRAEKADWDEYRYYPTQFFEPYLTRRRANGFGLYGALGIGRREVDRMRAQHDRNFVFFDAPVGMIFTIDRRLNQGSWIDYGMFLQNIMVAARGRGLHTCPQAAFAPYHRQIRPVLNIPDEEIVVCGMALGYEDTSKPENAFRTDRVPLEEWVSFSE